MTNLLERKHRKEREKAKEKAVKTRHRRIRILETVVLTVVIVIAVVYVVNTFSAANQYQRVVGNPPNTYQTGLLVANETRTFHSDTEWNFNFTPGSSVTLHLWLVDGQGAEVSFGTIAAFKTNLSNGLFSGPFVVSQTLKPSSSALSWTGTLSGGYKVEIVNVGSEGQVATIRAYVDAK